MFLAITQPAQVGTKAGGEMMSLAALVSRAQRRTVTRRSFAPHRIREARQLPLLLLHGPSRPPAPVLPGAIDAVGTGSLSHLVDLAGSEELDLAHVHGLPLQPRIDLEIDRNIDGVTDVPARHGCAMPAHQR